MAELDVSQITNGGITCGMLQLAYSTDIALLMGTGNLSATAVAIGFDTHSAVLTLGNGVHTIGTGGLAVSGTGLANALTYAGTVNVGGDQTLAGIAVTLAAGAVIKATAAVTVDGTLAAAEARTNNGADLFSDGVGKVLTLKDLAISGALLRAWCGCVLSGTVSGVQNLPGPPDEY